MKHQAEDAYGQSTGAEEKFVSFDAVQILTIHRAKGLQWPVVFVPQLVRNQFPASPRGGRNVWHLIPSAAVSGRAAFAGRRLTNASLCCGYAQPEAPPHDNGTDTGKKLYQHPQSSFMTFSKFVKRMKQNYEGRERGTTIQSINIERKSIVL
ncbi:3'-5' exonuclease [Rhodobacter capsulatus]|uniref:3'-5' exonuclease n=1 Tax=Rhodobacter capsulatus TaxID=1061 RepID=UPI004025DD85